MAENWRTAAAPMMRLLCVKRACVRRASMDSVVNMSPDKPKDDFDRHRLSTALKILGDRLGVDPELQALVNGPVKQQDSKTAFSYGVEALRQFQASAKMSPEMPLIKATVGFGLYVVKSSPDLKNTVQSAMTTLLNNNLFKWVAEQGGWNKVNI